MVSSLVGPWFVHGWALARPWLGLGSSLASPWCVLGSSLVCPWLILDLSVVCHWFGIGLSMLQQEQPQTTYRSFGALCAQTSGPSESIGVPCAQPSALMAVTQKWCLEDIILPFERRSLDLCTWSGPRAQSLKEDCGFLLLNLGGRSAHQWLSRYFRQPKRWWWSLSGTSQVIQDILDQYPNNAVRGRPGCSRGVTGLSRHVVVRIVAGR